jgi:predicted secreted protein
MITKRKIAVLTLAIIYPLSLCSIVLASDREANEAKVFIITKQQSGSEIQVKPDDIIQIELNALGSAGYNWYMDQINGECLEFISEKTKQVSEDRKIGAPVVIIWQFKAQKQGAAEIKIDYYRKWEGMEKSADHFSLKINVSDKRR